MNKIIGLSFFAACAFAAEWTGAISEAGCGAKHVDGSAGSIACVKACVGKGQAPVFVSGDKVIAIADEASKAKAMDHLGQKVKIVGTLSGEAVTIQSITKVE